MKDKITKIFAILVFVVCGATPAIAEEPISAQKHYQTIAMIMADLSEGALTFDDINGAQAILNALRHEPGIRVACLYNQEGMLIGKYPGTKEIFCPTEAENIAGFTMYHAESRDVNGQKVGELVLYTGG